MLRNVVSVTRGLARRTMMAGGGITTTTNIVNSSCKFSTGTPKTHVVMGCVCYDPAINDIWSGIKEYLLNKGVSFDYVLFTNYEAQVNSLLNGGIDVAWNGPIAHVMTEQMAPGNVLSLGMRDCDRDFESVVVARRDAMVENIDDLKNRNLLTGATDSPQAHVVPIYHLRNKLGMSSLGKVTAFDIDLGKHGDTALGEIKALEVLSSDPSSQQEEGEGDVAIVSKMMWERAIQGSIPSLDADNVKETCEELVGIDLPKFDHCQFDAISKPDNEQKLNHFGETLLSMNWDVPEEQHLMKLEGINRKWELPRQEGYTIVRNAMGISPSQHRPATNFNYQKRFFSTSKKSSPPPKRVAVVGAGIAGLQTIRALQARGFDVTAFEGSNTVGGLWKGNYAGFGVQVPKQLFEFQDYPMTSVSWGDYATGPEIQKYIESYADDFGLRHAIQFNTNVTDARQDDDGQWKIHTQTNDGKEDMLDFDYLVVATGLYSGLNPKIPSLPGKESFSGEIMHSDSFRDASVAKDKRVIVVGGGKSAVDCAVEASRSGAASVTLLERDVYWPTPRKIAGIIPFQYIFLSRLGTALVSAHRGTYPSSGKAVNAFRNSVIGPALMKGVFALVEELFAFQFGLRGDLRPKIGVVDSFYDTALVLNSDLQNARKDGKVDVQLGEIDHYVSDSTLQLKDGSSLEADMVVFATGFEQNYSLFSDPETRKKLNSQHDGLYLYRYMIPENISNLAFIGHVAAISNISTYGLQAEWLARNLTRDLVSGGATNSTGGENSAVMKKEIEDRKKWAQSWMPETANRGMLVLLHQTHYHDQLLKDMGLNPHRKSNVLAEYLMPYEPADYDGIVGGKAVC